MGANENEIISQVCNFDSIGASNLDALGSDCLSEAVRRSLGLLLKTQLDTL